MTTKKTLKEKVLDFYMTRPVIVDIVLISLVLTVLFFVLKKFKFVIDANNKLIELTSEVATASITIAGFIITIITIIVTFKNTINNNRTDTNKFKFYNSDFYFVTIKLLRNCVIVLVLNFAALLVLKVFYPLPLEFNLFLNLACLLLILLVFFRFLLILKIIVDFQK